MISSANIYICISESLLNSQSGASSNALHVALAESVDHDGDLQGVPILQLLLRASEGPTQVVVQLVLLDLGIHNGDRLPNFFDVDLLLPEVNQLFTDFIDLFRLVFVQHASYFFENRSKFA